MKLPEKLKAEHDGILQMLEILQRICDRMETHKQFKVKHLILHSFEQGVYAVRGHLVRINMRSANLN